MSSSAPRAMWTTARPSRQRRSRAWIPTGWPRKTRHHDRPRLCAPRLSGRELCEHRRCAGAREVHQEHARRRGQASTLRCSSAADGGFMPQTVEHLDILQLLGVKDGLIVLTKTDLVDEDWLNMLEEDVKSRVKGTFLEDKPILRTSVRTGEGVEALREALHDLTLHAEERARARRSACPSTACFLSMASARSSPARSSTGTSPSATNAAHAARESVPRAQFAGARARRVGGVRRTARGGQLSGHQKREHQPRRCAVQDGFDAAVADAGRETAKSAGF